MPAWLLFNAWRFGNPFDSGLLRDPVPAVGSPVVSGLAGLLFSPSTSIFLYSPVALVGLIGLPRDVSTLSRRRAPSAVAFIAFLVFYAQLGNWIRRMFVRIAISPRDTAAPRRRLVRPADYVAEWYADAGVSRHSRGSRPRSADTGSGRGLRESQSGRGQRARRLYDRTAPMGLARSADRVEHAGPRHRGACQSGVSKRSTTRSRSLLGATADEDNRGFSQQLSFSLDFWWLYLFYMHALSRTSMAIIVAAFLAGIISARAA